MNPTSEKQRFRGNYRQYDSRGYTIQYSVGDVVLYDGKRYIATANNVNSIPTKVESGWNIMSGDVVNYHYSDSMPLSANVGDRWVDRVTGRMYTYLEDKNGFHWVEF
jgi:hypothetical protein